MLGRHQLITLAATLGFAATAQGQTLTVAWYGGNWGDAFNACVAEPFTKATGVKVVPEIGTSTTTLAKLQQQKSAPTIDAAWMDGGISELAADADVVEGLDQKAIPNLANVEDAAIYRQGGRNYAVGTGYYSLGLVYNKQNVKQAPTSWVDLWKPEFVDAVTLPSPANSSGVPFIVFLGNVLGAPKGDYGPAFAKLKELKPALFFDSSGAASNAFQRGEAVIGAHFSAAAWDLIDKGLPLGFIVPKEGVWATDARLHLVKGSPHKAEAEKFIDTALTPGAARCLAEKLYLGPAVKNTSVPAEIVKKLPWGEKGSVKDLRLYDWTEVNRDRAKITDTWNREIARK
jgi:putative spermidine/putrescine transport system substrate-binding protein